MSIIGITGRISSGKSTVAGLIRRTCSDVVVLDVDAIAKDLYRENPEIKDELETVFGKKVFGANREILFDRLAGTVFSDKSKLLELNRIMFPRLRIEVKNRLCSCKNKKHIIIDAAVLFGAKLDVLCDYIILIESNEETRKRFLRNKKLSDNEIELKVKGQHIEINSSRVDYTIINDGDIKKLLKESVRVLSDIEGREKRDATEQV